MSDAAPKREFAFAAMDADGLSVSREDGAIVVICEDHDGRDTIQLSRAFALAAEYDLRVVDGEAHLGSRDVALVVAESGWRAGSGGSGGGGE